MAAFAVSMPAAGPPTPSFQTVHVGDTVTWTNSTGLTKDLRFGGQGGGPPDSPGLANAGTYSFTFGYTGTFSFSYDKFTGAVQVI